MSVEGQPETGASGRRFIASKLGNFVYLTSTFSVELPGIEPDALPGLLSFQLQFRYVSFRFVTVRYLRLRSRVLTASRVGVLLAVRCGAALGGDVNVPAHHRRDATAGA